MHRDRGPAPRAGRKRIFQLSSLKRGKVSKAEKIRRRSVQESKGRRVVEEGRRRRGMEDSREMPERPGTSFRSRLHRCH